MRIEVPHGTAEFKGNFARFEFGQLTGQTRLKNTDFFTKRCGYGGLSVRAGQEHGAGLFAGQL